MRLIAALAASAVLCGCVNTVQQRELFLAQFVGQPEEQVLRQFGVPSRSYDAGGHRFLAYTEQSVDVVPGIGGYGYGYGFGGLPPQVIQWVCETTFEIDSGRVVSFSLRGNAC